MGTLEVGDFATIKKWQSLLLDDKALNLQKMVETRKPTWLKNGWNSSPFRAFLFKCRGGQSTRRLHEVGRGGDGELSSLPGEVSNFDLKNLYGESNLMRTKTNGLHFKGKKVPSQVTKRHEVWVAISVFRSLPQSFFWHQRWVWW